MIVVALVFLAAGIADLAAGGLQGVPAGRRRAIVGIAAGWAATVAIGGVLRLPAATLGGLLALQALGLGAWIGGRAAESVSSRRAWWALGALALYLMGGIAFAGSVHSTATDGLDAWLADLPLPTMAGLDGGRLLWDVSLLVFAAATANAIVRAVLAGAGTKTRRSERRLRGGRLIGVLERWLILGLMIHGEPTAAALVASAKSILRFPELSRVARDSDDGEGARVDHVTEYFLLGSLVSWLVAIALALLRG